MIICYHRSSSLGTYEMCQMKYFFQYVLGMKDKTNKKAVMGTIFHRVMQVLADKSIAQRKKKRKLKNDDIQDMTFSECDDIDFVTRVCFDYYKSHEEDVGLDEADFRQCVRWVEKALAFNDGVMDPRNQNIEATEQFFDFEIRKDWAKYHYEVGDTVFDGYLSLKGTVDVIIREEGMYFQVLDYKTGQRKNWATGKEKTYEDLCEDKQLLLYYYALRNIFPDRTFYVSIYYVNHGGVFDIVFSDEDYEKAEQMLRQKFEEIKRTNLPKQISPSHTDFKCRLLCKFSQEYENTGISTCQHFHGMIRSRGMDYVVANHASLDKIGKYGAGGGRLEGSDK